MKNIIPHEKYFGNLALENFNEIFLPVESISLWPQTIGWKILFFCLAIFIIYGLYKSYKIWKENEYRRVAKQLLENIENNDIDDNDFLYKIFMILKGTSLKVYQREKVASLYGKKWIDFLHSKVDKECFDSVVANYIVQGQYQNIDLTLETKKNIVEQVSFWIQNHRLDIKDSHA